VKIHIFHVIFHFIRAFRSEQQNLFKNHEEVNYINAFAH